MSRALIESFVRDGTRESLETVELSLFSSKWMHFMLVDINSNPQYERMCESPSYASDPVLLDAVAIVARKSALSLQTDTRLLAYPPSPQ